MGANEKVAATFHPMVSLDAAAAPDVAELVDIDKPLVCLVRGCARSPLWYGVPPCGCEGPMCDNHKVEREAADRRGANMTCSRCRQHHTAPLRISWRPL